MTKGGKHWTYGPQYLFSWSMCLTSHGAGKLAWVQGIGAGTVINTLRPRQNGRHFADNIFNYIFFSEKVWISIMIFLRFVPDGPTNNISSNGSYNGLAPTRMVSLLTHICVTQPQWVNGMAIGIPQFCKFANTGRLSSLLKIREQVLQRLPLLKKRWR